MAKGNQYTTTLPKGISYKKRTNNYIAQYWNKELSSTIYIGSFDNIEDAITAREKYITNVYDGLIDETLPKTKGLPKGVNQRENGSYTSNIQYWYGKYKDKLHSCHLGTFETVEEAVEARNEFIKSLF